MKEEAGVSKTITAVKTSPHPTASPNPAGGEEKMSATRTALSGERKAEAGRAAAGEMLLPSPGASDQGASHYLSLSLPLCYSLFSAFPIGECQVPQLGVW